MCAKPGEPTLEPVTWGSTLPPKIEPGLGWYRGNRPGVFWSSSLFTIYNRGLEARGDMDWA